MMDFRKKELIMSIEKLEARVITECKEEKQQNDALEIKKYVHLEKYEMCIRDRHFTWSSFPQQLLICLEYHLEY